MTSTVMAFHLVRWRHHLFHLAMSGSRPSYRPAIVQELNLLPRTRCVCFIKNQGGEEEEEEEDEVVGDAGGDYFSLLRSGSWQSKFISAFLGLQSLCPIRLCSGLPVHD